MSTEQVSYDIHPEYELKLHHTVNKRKHGYSERHDYWDVAHSTGLKVGEFVVKRRGPVPRVFHSWVNSPYHKHKGIGELAYRHLVKQR